MFLYVDESGKSDCFQLAVLRFAQRRVRNLLRAFARRERRRFQEYLERTGGLPSGVAVSYLTGTTRDKDGVPGIGRHPNHCISFFKRFAKICQNGKNCQIYGMMWIDDPRHEQKLPGEEESDREGVFHKNIKYTHFLRDILNHVRPFPEFRVNRKVFKITNNPGKKYASKAMVQRLCVMVVDEMDDKKKRRARHKAFSQRILDRMRHKTNKLGRARLTFWFNKDDLCLQIVDVLSNFFFQGRRLGIGLKRKWSYRNPRILPFPGIPGETSWTIELWKKAIAILTPCIGYWNTTTWY